MDEMFEGTLSQVDAVVLRLKGVPSPLIWLNEYLLDQHMRVEFGTDHELDDARVLYERLVNQGHNLQLILRPIPRDEREPLAVEHQRDTRTLRERLAEKLEVHRRWGWAKEDNTMVVDELLDVIRDWAMMKAPSDG